MAHHMTPIGAVGRGLVAGAAGTAVMTGCQMLAEKLRTARSDEGSEDGSGERRDPWEEAPTPAKVARRVVEGVFHRELSPERIPQLTNLVHWAYGTGWGAVYGLIAGSRRNGALAQGAAFGAAVWAMSYVELVPMGLYEPPWAYPPTQLAMEGSYHLAYGIGVGLAFAAGARA